MSLPGIWVDAALGRAEELPLVRQLGREQRQAAASGLVFGALLAALLGGILGAINRGLLGFLIGAISGALLGGAVGVVIGLLVGRATPARDARARLRFVLDQKPNRYGPGETVGGYVEINADNTFRTDGALVYFVCRGFYAHSEPPVDGQGEPEFIRESRQYLVQQQDLIEPGRIRKGSCATRAFDFAIPQDALPTHRGYACSLRWTLHAVLDGPGDSEMTAQQEILVESQPPALQATSGRYQTESDSAECRLTLSLARAICAEGDSITARIHASPLQPLTIRDIRAVLLRIENTPLGDDHTVYIDRWDADSGSFRGHRLPGGKGTTYVWLEDEAILTEPGQTEFAHPLVTTVSLAIPAQWRPTFSTKDGRTIWKVGVIVAKADGPDIRAFHEIIVHTGVTEMTEMLNPERTPSIE